MRIIEGAVIAGLRIVGGRLTIINQATSTAPISDFQNFDQVQIGLRDDADVFHSELPAGFQSL